MLSGMRGVVIISVLAGAMGGFAASAILGTAGVAGQPDPTMFQVVRAKEFELIDVQGRTRGRIGFSADAQPYLQLRDENDLSGVWIGISRETGLAVSDTDGRTRLVLSVNESGNPSLVIRDRDHNTRSFQPER